MSSDLDLFISKKTEMKNDIFKYKHKEDRLKQYDLFYEKYNKIDKREKRPVLYGRAKEDIFDYSPLATEKINDIESWFEELHINICNDEYSSDEDVKYIRNKINWNGNLTDLVFLFFMLRKKGLFISHEKQIGKLIYGTFLVKGEPFNIDSFNKTMEQYQRDERKSSTAIEDIIDQLKQ